ncbi:hypothetical protein BD309DRAFT_968605 [Dichomitus squalens]|nr:hypothetical protein BD309DRAFT_968605 [Dichomitus squalens]
MQRPLRSQATSALTKHIVLGVLHLCVSSMSLASLSPRARNGILAALGCYLCAPSPVLSASSAPCSFMNAF